MFFFITAVNAATYLCAGAKILPVTSVAKGHIGPGDEKAPPAVSESIPSSKQEN